MFKHVLACAGAMIAPSVAHADVATMFYSVTGTNFHADSTPATPVLADKVQLRFKLTIDPSTATNIDATNAGLDIVSFNLPYKLYYAFASSGIMIIATNPQPAGCAITPNSFCAMINNPFGSRPRVLSLEQAGTQGIWSGRTNSVSSYAVVPEPGAWTMLLLGFGVLGGAVRYRRRIARQGLTAPASA